MARYLEVRAEIRWRIESGLYAPGSQLPSLSVLAEEFGETGTMIRHAQAGLIEDGFIRSAQGLGSWVCDPLPVADETPVKTALNALDAALAALETAAEQVRTAKRALID